MTQLAYLAGYDSSACVTPATILTNGIYPVVRVVRTSAISQRMTNGCQLRDSPEPRKLNFLKNLLGTCGNPTCGGMAKAASIFPRFGQIGARFDLPWLGQEFVGPSLPKRAIFERRGQWNCDEAESVAFAVSRPTETPRQRQLAFFPAQSGTPRADPRARGRG